MRFGSTDNTIVAIERFSAEMNVRKATHFAWRWLSKVAREKFVLGGWDTYCDDDAVENMPAFRIFVENWGHVGGSPYAVCAILPCWAWIGQ